LRKYTIHLWYKIDCFSSSDKVEYALKSGVPNKEISIILPAFNEAAQIELCVRKVEDVVKSFSKSYEIIVSEDGSTDGTDVIVAKLAKINPNLVLLHSPSRLGKGKGIKNALSSSKGKIITFMDVDLATNLECLPQLLRVVKENGGMAIGSRHVTGSRVQRRVSRTLFSLTYNLAVRLLFLDGIHDHQCGFKTMSREVAEAVLNVSKSDGYFFDTEMIVRCKQLGFPVAEVPVQWAEKNKGNSKVNPVQDAKKIGLDMLAFRLNSSKNKPS
jgi:glycosyltransferase involved in cell wall biosynthesis